MIGLPNHVRDVVRYIGLAKTQRRLTFYSEGKNYWPHLEGLVKGMLATQDLVVCYVSSDRNDPGLRLQHPNYRTFEIGEGFVRDWFFQNIETDVLVMTMPDLHNHQIKRSKHHVHYIYVQHSLVSLHMIYRKGAFDHFDTIFCSGSHHIAEVRAMEEAYGLPAKNVLEHGYGRLDAIIAEAKNHQQAPKPAEKPKHILIAPSWGPEATIESGQADQLVDQLIAAGFQITLRPHPQTAKFAQNRLDAIGSKHADNPLFAYETNVAGQSTLHDADIMISDWSGAAFDFAFGLNKPVLFVDVPRKVINPDYQEIGVEPFEVAMREKIGCIINSGTDFRSAIENSAFNTHGSEFVYNISNSSQVGCDAISDLLDL